MEKLEERSAGQGRSALVTQADPMGAPEPERPSVLQGHVGSSLSNQALDTSCDPRLAGPSLKGSPHDEPTTLCHFSLLEFCPVVSTQRPESQHGFPKLQPSRPTWLQLTLS